jgi:hypothetical protein
VKKKKYTFHSYHPLSLGDDGSIQRTRQYTNAIAILDTKTWTWSIPTISGIPPSRRSFASAAILDGQHFTAAFGKD